MNLNLLPEFGYFYRGLADLALQFHIGLSGWKKTLLALKEEGLATVLIVATDEFITKIVHKNFTIPSLTAVHAVSILCGL
jgi:hypothetical protein